MPFTPTHILAALPVHFSYRKLLLSPLAVGSMIPDFVMFFPISDYHFSHSLVGLFAYCLPMGMLVYYLWELCGKEFAIALSPQWVQYRIYDYRRSKPRLSVIDILLTAIAIVIGSITHIVWDAFTHKGEWGVELIPLLASKLEIVGMGLPGYKLFQYGSTFIGLPLLLYLGFLYLKNIKSDCGCQASLKDSASHQHRTVETYSFKTSGIYGITCSFVVIPIAIAFYYLDRAESFKSIIGNTIKQSIGAGIILFFLYAILFKLVIREKES